MKYLYQIMGAIVLILGTYAPRVGAQAAYEILGGALTQHFTNYGGVSSGFSNKLSADGTLILNPTLVFRTIDYSGLLYTTSSVFGGENSIGEMMVGGAASLGVRVDHVRLGLVAGAYGQDDQKYHDRNIRPFSAEIGRYGIVPMAGVEFSIDVPLNAHAYLSVYTVVTPVLSSTMLGIGWDL